MSDRKLQGGGGERQAARRGEVEQGARLRQVGGQRLLAIDVLAGEQRRLRHGEMRLDACQVDDQLDIVGEQRGIVVVDAEAIGAPDGLGAGAVDVEHTADDQLGVGAAGCHVVIEDIAAADEGDRHRAVGHRHVRIAARTTSIVAATARLSASGIVGLSVRPAATQRATSSAS